LSAPAGASSALSPEAVVVVSALPLPLPLVSSAVAVVVVVSPLPPSSLLSLLHPAVNTPTARMGRDSVARTRCRAKTGLLSLETASMGTGAVTGRRQTYRTSNSGRPRAHWRRGSLDWGATSVLDRSVARAYDQGHGE
jgi:hypothetical protein